MIGSMPSPCYGELANGTKQKASSAATILHTLEKVHVLRWEILKGKTLFVIVFLGGIYFIKL